MNEAARISASPEPEAKPFAYVANPNHRMPRTVAELVELYRSTGRPQYSAIEIGGRLTHSAIHAIIGRELAGAITHCAEEDLLIIVDAIRLCRELHGENSRQTGNLIGAILQTLGFGAGEVLRSEDGEELDVRLPV